MAIELDSRWFVHAGRVSRQVIPGDSIRAASLPTAHDPIFAFGALPLQFIWITQVLEDRVFPVNPNNIILTDVAGADR